MCAAQEHAIRTNYIKHHIGENIGKPLCRMWGENEKVCMIDECNKLLHHDNVAEKIHWKL